MNTIQTDTDGGVVVFLTTQSALPRNNTNSCGSKINVRPNNGKTTVKIHNMIR